MHSHQPFLQDLRHYLEYCFKHSHHVFSKEKKYTVSEMVENGECPASTSFCKEASFVARYFLNNIYGEKWNVAGGYCHSTEMRGNDILKPSIIKDIQNNGESIKTFGDSWLIKPDMSAFGLHWWLEKDGVILDISADQFGHEQLVITTIDDPRYIKELDKSGDLKLAEGKQVAMQWINMNFRNSAYKEEIEETRANISKNHPDFAKLLPLDKQEEYTY